MPFHAFSAHFPRFSDYLRSRCFLHGGQVLDRLVARHPKVAEDFLSAKLDSNHDQEVDEGDDSLEEDPIELRIDLSPFYRASRQTKGVFNHYRFTLD